MGIKQQNVEFIRYGAPYGAWKIIQVLGLGYGQIFTVLLFFRRYSFPFICDSGLGAFFDTVPILGRI